MENEVQGAVRKKRGHVVFAMTGAEGLEGGIASLNRNILRAVGALARDSQRPLSVLSLHEAPEHRPQYLDEETTYSACEGRKGRFALRLAREALRARVIIFDHVALAAPILPFSKSGALQTIIFAHGPEAWANVRRRSIFCYRAATRVLTNSEFTLRKMRQRFDGFDGVACPLGLSPDFVLNETIPESALDSVCLTAADGRSRLIGEHVFLLVGRMDPRQRGKGHKELIEALVEVRRCHEDAQLVFPGPGAGREELASLACRLGVGDAVFLPGFVSTSLLEKLYQLSFAFTMPSRQDGFGLAYLEAMNYGLACVGCRGDGGECVIIDGQTGMLLPPAADASSVARALIALCNDPLATRQMGEAGFELLHREFTADAFRARFIGHVSSLLA